MSDSSVTEDAVETLQELGLKEYEAKCFVALSRLSHGTAKRISEISDVPRTRVYDATRVLQNRGLVEVQHSNPQQFRAVDIEIAIRTLQSEYEERVADLRNLLGDLEPVQTEATGDSENEVWALSDTTAITNRLKQLIEGASDEVRMLIRGEHHLPERVLDALTAAGRRGVAVSVGASTEELTQALEERTSHVETFVTDVDWLLEPQREDDVVVNRLIVVDGETILVSSAPGDSDTASEHAAIGTGGHNGLVVILRRLLAQKQSGLHPS